MTVSPSPSLAGVESTYTIHFTTSATSSTSVTVAAPSGTVLPNVASDYTLNNTAASGSVTGGGTNTVTVNASTSAAGANTLVITDVANPTQPSSTYTASVNTNGSGDTSPVASSAYSITSAGTNITGLNVTPSPSTAGATSQYKVSFAATSGVASTGTIDLRAPTGTSFPTAATDYTITVPGVNSGNPFTPSSAVNPGALANYIELDPGLAIPTGATVAITASGVTNPAAGSDTLSGFTSSDTTPQTSNTYTIATAPTQVTFNSGPTLSNTSAGGTSQYTVQFTTSNSPTGSGALAANSGTITLTGPTGTNFPTLASDYVVKDNTSGAAPTAASTVAVTSSGTVVTITTPVAIAAADNVTVTANNVTNPTTVGNYDAAGGVGNFYINTSADTAQVEGSAYSISAAATTVKALTLSVSPASAGNANATYTATFQPTTSLVAGTDFIYLDNSANAGAIFPAAGPYFVNNVSATGAVVKTGEIKIAVPLLATNTGAGQTVTVVAEGATNPTNAGTYTLDVFTSKDTNPATANYTLTVAGTSVTGVTGPSPTNNAANATATYTLGFVSTHALAAGSGTITFAAPTGTVFPSTASDYIVTDTTTSSGAVAASTVAVSNSGATVTITTPVAVSAGDTVSVTANGVTNPYTGSSTDQIAVSTSADTAPVNTANYTITAPAAPSVTAVSPTSGPATGGTTVTITGTSFRGASAVSFGGVAASSYSVVSNTSITAVSPAGTAGKTVDVTVTNSGGTSVTSTSDQFTYTAAPALTTETPTRIYDSRTTSPLVPGSPRTIQVAGLGNVPSNATAVAVNVTAINPAGVGNLRVYPAGGTTPNVSTINYVPGQTVANFDIVGLSGGQATLQTFGSNVDVTVDVTGWFTGTTAYTPLASPQRVLDSRPGSGLNQADMGPLMPGTAYPVQVTGLDGIPAGATSVAVNVTAIQPAGNGNLRVYPAGATAPNASTINYIPGNTTANFDVVKPVNGMIDVQTFGSAVNVTVDVVGYSMSTGLTTQTPARILDTRPGSGIGTITGPVAPGTVESVQVAGVAGVPSNAEAVLVNVTAVQPSGTGNLRVYPDASGNGSTAAPGASNINYITGATSANFVLVQLPADGKVDFETFGSSTNVLIDVVGYVPAGT